MRFKQGACPLFFLASFLLLSQYALASSNIPVGNKAYMDLERLEIKGLIPSSMLSTKPFSRIEAGRLAREALAGSGERTLDPSTSGLIERLIEKYGDEEPDNYFKPVMDPYARVLVSGGDPHFTDVNNNGDPFGKGINFRSGFSAEAGLAGRFTLYLNPEYRASEQGSKGRLIHGYVKLEAGGAELLAGRDSMWWGPGSHGDLLMTNNARPFDMVKLTSARPFLLPGFLGRAGLLRPTVFLTSLDEQRDFPRANLLGMRLDFKPTPRLHIGLSRVFMFGGEGRRSLEPSDWLKVFIADDSSEHEGSPINGNQIASIDASYIFVNRHRLIPFSGVKLYTEWGGRGFIRRDKNSNRKGEHLRDLC